MRQKDIRPAPARIEFKGMKFLITDRPSDQTIQNYILVSVWALIYLLTISWEFLDFIFENEKNT